MTRSFTAYLPSGLELSVDYDVTSWGAPATYDDPAEAVEIEVEGAWAGDVPGGPDMWPHLDADERDRIENEILEQLERDGPPDDEPDDWRDDLP